MWTSKMDERRKAGVLCHFQKIADGEKIKAEAGTGMQDMVGSSWCPLSIYDGYEQTTSDGTITRFLCPIFSTELRGEKTPKLTANNLYRISFYLEHRELFMFYVLKKKSFDNLQNACLWS